MGFSASEQGIRKGHDGLFQHAGSFVTHPVSLNKLDAVYPITRRYVGLRLT